MEDVLRTAPMPMEATSVVAEQDMNCPRMSTLALVRGACGAYILRVLFS